MGAPFLVQSLSCFVFFIFFLVYGNVTQGHRFWFTVLFEITES